MQATMEFSELREVINEMLAAIPDGRVELHEAEDWAPKMQRIRADIASIQLNMEIERNKYKAVSKTQFKNAILTAHQKFAAEKEAAAKADPDYLNTLEHYDNLESRIDYCRTMSDIFHNYHIYYRQVAKGE